MNLLNKYETYEVIIFHLEHHHSFLLVLLKISGKLTLLGRLICFKYLKFGGMNPSSRVQNQVLGNQDIKSQQNFSLKLFL